MRQWLEPKTALGSCTPVWLPCPLIEIGEEIGSAACPPSASVGFALFDLTLYGGIAGSG
jgi:hypothetical protein